MSFATSLSNGEFEGIAKFAPILRRDSGYFPRLLAFGLPRKYYFPCRCVSPKVLQAQGFFQKAVPMNNSRIPVILIGLLAVAIVAAVVVFQYTRLHGPDAIHKKDNDAKAELVYLENGLAMDDRKIFYHLAEGSEVYPVLWMQALQTKEGKPFLGEVEKLGFLPDPNNLDRLPVGLTSGITRGLETLGPMTGLNCAACHVGELHYNGKRVRIDGAPNLLNTRQFFV